MIAQHEMVFWSYTDQTDVGIRTSYATSAAHTHMPPMATSHKSPSRAAVSWNPYVLNIMGPICMSSGDRRVAGTQKIYHQFKGNLPTGYNVPSTKDGQEEECK